MLKVGMKANYTFIYEGRKTRRFGFVITKVGSKYATLTRQDEQMVLGNGKDGRVTLTTYPVTVTVRVLLEVVEPLGKREA